MRLALQQGSQIVARTCHHLVLQRARVNWRQTATARNQQPGTLGAKPGAKVAASDFGWLVRR
jgi:hypothetical protein